MRGARTQAWASARECPPRGEIALREIGTWYLRYQVPALRRCGRTGALAWASVQECPLRVRRRLGLCRTEGSPIDWIEDAGPINQDAGYGPWPSVEGGGGRGDRGHRRA